MPKIIGVYKIVTMVENNITGKVYIGESNNIERRWEEHKTDLNNNIHQKGDNLLLIY